MDALKKYWAFLSYSHQDTKVCEWLHQQLETFRIPKHFLLFIFFVEFIFCYKC